MPKILASEKVDVKYLEIITVFLFNLVMSLYLVPINQLKGHTCMHTSSGFKFVQKQYV